MDLKAFLMERVLTQAEEEYLVSQRFLGEDKQPAPFLLCPIGETEHDLLRRACMRDGKIDVSDYLAGLVCACVKRPDLRDAALQKSWGVLGEQDLIRKMLLPGEYAGLLKRVQALCGFDVEEDPLREQIKNASGGATGN